MLLLYIPIRLIAEPDPFWRFPLWLEAGVLIGISCLFMPRKVWPALFFLLTALPWPAFLETVVVQQMTLGVTLGTQEALLWFGIPVERSGHVLTVQETEILINNTCSGIRSLQSLLALGIFLGLFWRFSVQRFLILLLTVVLSAWFFNSVRAVSLALLQLHGSKDFYVTWHDPVGYLSVGISFAVILFAAHHLRTSSPMVIQDFQLPPNRIGRWAILGVLPELVCWLWFAFVPLKTSYVEWSINWPSGAKPIEKPVEEVLQFDYGGWSDVSLTNGLQAKVIYFGYDGTSPAASICSLNHDPATCMAHLGTHLSKTQQVVRCEVGEVKLDFLHFVADTKVPLDVWWCQNAKDSRSGEWNQTAPSLIDKLNRFLSGKVSFERKVLLIIIPRADLVRDPSLQLKELVSQLVVETT